MTDPLTALGAAASATQFIGLARRISVRLYDYHSTAGRAPRTLLSIQELIPIMMETCEIAKEQQSVYDSGTDKTLNKFVDQMLARLRTLDESTRDLLPLGKEGRMQRTAKAIRCIAKEKELVALQRGLETSNNLLANYLTAKCSHPTALQKTVHLFPSAIPGVQRKNLLERINCSLSQESPKHPRVVVLYGIGGQGKTRLALDACRVQQFSRDVIIWINASSIQSLRLDFAASIRALTLRRQSIYDPDAAVASINTALAGKTWLIVFDNYDDPGEVGRIVPYFPSNGTGAIVVTTRHREVRNLGQAIDVGGMEESEAIELLLSRTKHSREDGSSEEQAQEVVRLLGYLPLAIDQASAYIGERNLRIESFERHYYDRMHRIFNQTPTSWDYKRTTAEEEPVRDIPQSVMTTWELSFDRLHEPEDVRRHLARFLSIAAFMTENSISEEIFSEFQQDQPGPANSDHWLSVFCVDGKWDNYIYHDFLAKLSNLSLIQDLSIEGELASFTLHPIVKQWLQLRVTGSDRGECIKEASHILASCFSSCLLQMSRQRSEQVLSHRDAVASNSKPFLDFSSPFSTNDLRDPAAQVAKVHASRASRTRRRLDDPVIVDNKYQLADIYISEGNFSEARSLLESIPSLNDSQLAQSCRGSFEATMGLARLSAKTDELQQACALYEKALSSCRADEASRKAKEVEILGRLAGVYRFKGEHDKALALYEEALSKNNQPLSLNTLNIKVSLANLYRSKAQYLSAKTLYAQAAEGFIELLGPDHPKTASALCNLAIAHRNLEEWQDAEEVFWRAITLLEYILGPNHLHTLRARMNLAILYEKRGQTAIARDFYAQVLVGREEKLGLCHSYTLRTVERLCTMMLLSGAQMQAEQLALRTLRAGGKSKVGEAELKEYCKQPTRLSALQKLFVLAIDRERKKLAAEHVDLLEAQTSLEEVVKRRRSERFADEKNFEDKSYREMSETYNNIDTRARVI